jgi:GT2 family glycosyltransferase
VDPALVHGPSPLEEDPDRLAASRALVAALAGGPERTLLFHGARVRGPDAAFVDVSAAEAAVQAALRCFPERAAERDGGPEAFVPVTSREAAAVRRSAGELVERLLGPGAAPWAGLPRATAVVSTWNKKEDLRANLEALRAQTLPFAQVVVVDNASRDGTAELVAREFPEVRLVVMPHERYGACETFNIGFASVTTELTAILDDDIVMPPEWLERATRRLVAEPPTTAVVSTQVIEPGMPESYRTSAAVNAERYMSTFRGCASLARSAALRQAGFYDERLFIYGNERDLTCRLLNLGYRVLQYPGCHVFHKTPFGVKLGQRSLYYHARNAWLSMLKYAPLSDLVRMPWLVLTRVLLRGSRQEAAGTVTDAVGTIGIGRAVRETPGAWRVLLKAAGSVLANVPYCLRHRQPCRADDFELPLS